MTELRPYLCVSDARAAIDWYVQVLAAEVTYQPIMMDDGRVGHVELAIGDAHWMMADAFPEVGVEPPLTDCGSAVSLHLTVDDVDAHAERVVAAGVPMDRGRKMRNMPSGSRSSMIRTGTAGT